MTKDNKKRKIAVVTGTRAEYGLLYGVIKRLHNDSKCKFQLIVTGTHLCSEFGLTVKEIKKDKFPISGKVNMQLVSDTETAIATSMGTGMIGFAKTYAKLKPDIIVVLGDRFEILSAVAAAVPFKIPVAHIHGGESTQGAIDELIRHAITKMSHIHFTSTEEYRKRVIQMGEKPERVFCVGAPGLDNISKLGIMNKKELFNLLEIPQNRKVGVVTYHPVTLGKDNHIDQINQVLKAMKLFNNIFWVITSSNADTGGRGIIRTIKKFVSKNPDIAKCFISLGHQRYMSLLKHAHVMVGNSSSGLIEAPHFKLPVVNIGDRQRGRIKAKNIIDASECKENVIKKAIDKALSDSFLRSLKNLKNPYWHKGANKSIINKLKMICLDENLIKKEFYDLAGKK